MKETESIYYDTAQTDNILVTLDTWSILRDGLYCWEAEIQTERECQYGDLLSRVWRTVMTRRGISVIRKRPITITSMRVVLCESRCFLLSRITCNMTWHENMTWQDRHHMTWHTTWKLPLLLASCAPFQLLSWPLELAPWLLSLRSLLQQQQHSLQNFNHKIFSLWHFSLWVQW